MGGLSQQYQTGLSRQSQTHSGAWSSLIAGLVGLAHWHGDQADGQQASHGGASSDESRVDGASDAPLAAFWRRASAQHLLHRAVPLDRQRTAGYLKAQVSPCRPAAPNPL